MKRETFLEEMEKANANAAIDIPWRRQVIQNSINSNLPDGNPRGHRNLIITMEELSELQKEVSKELRGKGDRVSILEEMADVEVCMMYLKELLNISDCDIQKAIHVKLERLEKILREKGGCE